MTRDDEEMRPDLRFERLQELLTMAEGVQEDIAGALDGANAIMKGGEAWDGPTTATLFREDLAYRSDDLPSLAEQLVEDIRAELFRTATEIPVADTPVGAAA